VRSTIRTSRAAAVLCIAIVVFAAFVPATAAALAAVVLTPLWLVFAAVLVTIVRRSATCSDVQPIALLSLVLFRAPPHA